MSKVLTLRDVVAEAKPSLDVTSQRISKLVPPISNANIVVSLDVGENRLRDLEGLEAFIALEELNLEDNILPSIDKRTRARSLVFCCRLLKLNLRRNNISAIDASCLELPLLKELNLQENVLREVPDLSLLPSLESIWLDENEIDSLDSLQQHHSSCPLRCIGLRGNEISRLGDFQALTTFAETLTNIDVAGNPAVVLAQDRGVDLLPFFVFLTGNLSTLDDVSTAPGQGASLSLFRRGSDWDDEALRLLESSNDELISYLLSLQHPQPPPKHPSVSPTPVAPDDVRKRLQKVHSWTVTLRQVDMAKRVLAVNRLIPFVRGFLVRNSLWKRNPKYSSWRAAVLRKRGTVLMTRMNSTRSHQRTYAHHSQNLRDALTQQRFEKLEVFASTLWKECEVFRSILNQVMRNSAKKIQAWWRITHAKKVLKMKRRSFDAFRKQFNPFATRIQSVVRMFLQRKWFLKQLPAFRRQQQQARDIALLKQQVQDLMTVVLRGGAQQHQHQGSHPHSVSTTGWSPVSASAFGQVASPAVDSEQKRKLLDVYPTQESASRSSSRNDIGFSSPDVVAPPPAVVLDI